MNWTLDDSCNHAVLCWLATCVDGQPNVSPKEMWLRDGEFFAIAEIASPQSLRNIRSNPQVCVSLIDIFRQRGHKIIGPARIVGPGDSRLSEALHNKAGPDFPIRNVIEISIERSQPIVAPSWKLFPERDADEHIRRTCATYGVA